MARGERRRVGTKREPADVEGAGAVGLSGLALLLALGVFALAYAVALTAPGASYSWSHDMVSDLGRSSCRTWYGSWVCSPRADWFNLLIAVTGALLLLCTRRLHDLWGPSFSLATAGLGAGLIWLAVFASDGLVPVHMVGAVLALPVPAAALTIAGWRAETPWIARRRWMHRTLGLVALVLCLDHLAPAPAPIPRGAAETVTIALLVIVLVDQALQCLRADTGARTRHAPR